MSIILSDADCGIIGDLVSSIRELTFEAMKIESVQAKDHALNRIQALADGIMDVVVGYAEVEK